MPHCQSCRQWYGPAIAGIRLPVRGKEHVGEQKPVGIEVIMDVRVREQLTDPGPAGIAGERPGPSMLSVRR